MNNNPYARNYMPTYNNINQQNIGDQIDYQINQLQQMKEQMKSNTVQTPAINQTFQIAPSNNNGMKYVNTIDDVSKEQVFFDTPFFSKDMSVVWIKNTKGDIKSYELNEIIPKDEKDIQIEFLQSQIEELRGMINNDANVTNADREQNATDTTRDDKSTREEPESKKSTGLPKIPRSKKE